MEERKYEPFDGVFSTPDKVCTYEFTKDGLFYADLLQTFELKGDSLCLTFMRNTSTYEFSANDDLSEITLVTPDIEPVGSHTVTLIKQ